MRIPVISAFVLILCLAPLWAGSEKGVFGDYLEVRSNHVYTCGCLYSGELVTGGREAILAWNIRGGSFEGMSLDNTRVVAVVVADSSLSLGQAPRHTALYLDGTSSTQQEKALVDWMREEYPDLIGSVVHVSRSPIDFLKDIQTVKVRVEGVVRLDVRDTKLPQDAHLGSQRWYDPFVDLSQSRLATVTHDEYQGGDFSRRWVRQEERIAGFMGEFK